MGKKKDSFIFSIIKFLGNSVLAFLAFMFFIVFISSYFHNPKQLNEQHSETKLNKRKVLSILNQNRAVPDSTYISQSRCWDILKTENYACAEYRIAESEILEQTIYRENKAEPMLRNATDVANYWPRVYSRLYKHNINGLKELKDTLGNFAKLHQLGNIEFANYLVSYVQDMPYWYVMNQDVCKQKAYSNAPCISGIKFGLLSPSEIAATAVGDCDSRTLLLYSLFRHFNYKVVILVSNKYEHAVLGLNIPSSGLYKEHLGVKYYLWETTSTRWESGMLPPDFNNLNYWKFALHTNA